MGVGTLHLESFAPGVDYFYIIKLCLIGMFLLTIPTTSPTHPFPY